MTNLKEINLINSPERVREFIGACVEQLGTGFHPDTDFHDYVKEDESKLYNDAECDQYNGFIDEAFEVCEAHGLDIYGIVMEFMRPLVLEVAATFKVARFEIEGSDSTYAGFYDPSMRWNNFAVPYFEADAVHLILEDLQLLEHVWNEGTLSIEADGEKTVYAPIQITVEGEKKTVYSIGAYRWAWTEVEQASTDLFQTPELLPAEVQELLTVWGECGTYDRCKMLLKILEPLGYTFDYYLDAEPFNLRPIQEAANKSFSIKIEKADAPDETFTGSGPLDWTLDYIPHMRQFLTQQQGNFTVSIVLKESLERITIETETTA